MINIVTNSREPAKTFILNEDACPDDGAYKVVDYAGEEYDNVIVNGDTVILFGQGLMTVYLDFAEIPSGNVYVLERCICNITFE